MRALLILWLTALLAACGGGSSPDTPPPTPAPTTVQADGVVVDERGLPLAAATVQVLSDSAVSGTSRSVTTDAEGRFTLTLDAAVPAVVRVDKSGYTRGFQAVSAAADNARLAPRVVLLPVASTQDFDPTQAAVLRVPGSVARVELAAGSLVRANGQAPSGTASVALTPIDPSADIARMPGLMVDSSSGVPIESLGAMTVNFTDATGAALNLASGRTATLRIPATAAAGAGGSLPASFPLYHLDEATGRWTREGTATLKTDPANGAPFYESQVSHFSTWNADQEISRAFVDLSTTLGGTVCTASAAGQVQAVGLDYNGITAANAGTLAVRAGSQVRLRLVDRLGQVLDTLDLASGPAAGSQRLPRCLSAPATVRVSGRVVLASGSLGNQRVQISGERATTVTVPVQSDGSYVLDVAAGAGTLHARLVAPQDYGTPPTQVSTEVGSTATSFPDLVISDQRFTLQGCVQGWAEYGRPAVLVSVFRDGERLGQPQVLRSASPAFQFDNLPLNATLSLRLTPADPTLAEVRRELVVGATAPVLDACLDLPRAPAMSIQSTRDGLTVNYTAQRNGGTDPALVSRLWSFGDGATGSGASVSHTYAAEGTYEVTLTVTDALGQVSSARLSQTVTAVASTLPLTPRIEGGDAHNCATTPAGGLKCWGFNSAGPLGDGSTTLRTSAVSVFGLDSGVASVTTGAYSTCALTQDGTVRCWGLNGSGQLGDGTNTNSSVPVVVTGLEGDVVAVSAGWEHVCALTRVGGVKCWGAGSSGQLGNGVLSPSNLPVDVAGLSSGVIAIASGYVHTCALTSAGAVRCWGSNGTGSLGDDTTNDRRTPVDVVGLSAGVLAIDSFGNHTCAITAARGLVCWGLGLSGQLGQGDAVSSARPVAVQGLDSGVAAVSIGSYHTCALTQAGDVLCWGFNSRGQLGDGTTTTRRVPGPPVAGLGSGVVALGTGGSFSCALFDTGSARCWGNHGGGTLGHGASAGGFSTVPVEVRNLP